jgi:toxin-antitoxin system PIN domain toxin
VLLIDANVLLNAVNRSAREHDASRRWLEAALSGQEALGFATAVVLAFVRIATKRAAVPRPLAVEEAFAAVEAWLQAPPALLVEPTRRHFPLLRSLLASSGTGGNLVNDAHLAALALEHDATVISFDRDFERFQGVRWRPPD